MKFSKCLLVLDSDVGNELALARAIQLARNVNAKLTVCDVVDSVPVDYRRLVTSTTPSELTAAIVAKTRKRLEELLETVDRDGLALDIKVLTGKAHIEIARLVRKGRYDLVIKPISGQRGLLARSVTRKNRELMRHCPCPVWLINVADLADDGCVIAALDMPEDGAGSSELNEQILAVARAIALATFRPLHVVHAWTMSGEGHLRARGTARSNRKVDRMVAREAINRSAWLRNAVFTTRSDSEQVAIDFIAPELHAIKGKANKVLPDIAEELGAGLVVMGTAGRSGLPGMLIGNTSEALLHRLDCSLLIVKEPGSISLPASAGGLAVKPASPGKGSTDSQHAGV